MQRQEHRSSPEGARSAEERSPQREAGDGVRGQLRELPSYAAQRAALVPGGPIHLSRRPGGADGGRSPAEAFGQATSGPARELPHRGAMEQAFGRDLGGVRAFVGDPQARAGLSALGASGAASGGDVAFADPSPSRELVAHEVTHVLQGGGGVQAKSEVAPAGDAAEVEADQVAARVAAGQPAGPIGAAGGGLRLKRAHRTTLDGGKVRADDEDKTPLQVGERDPADPNVSVSTNDLGDGRVVVGTEKKSDATFGTASTRSVTTDDKVEDPVATGKALLAEMRSATKDIDEHRLPELEARRERLEAAKATPEGSAEANGPRFDVDAELAAVEEERKRLVAKKERLAARTEELGERLGDEAAAKGLTVEELKAISAEVGGTSVEVAYRSEGSQTFEEGSGFAVEHDGVRIEGGSLVSKTDADGNQSGEGKRYSGKIGVKDGRVGGELEQKAADGSSVKGSFHANEDGAAAEGTWAKADGRSTTVGATVDKDGGSASYASKGADGVSHELGAHHKKGKDGAEDEWGLTAGLGKADTDADKKAAKDKDNVDGNLEATLSTTRVGGKGDLTLPRWGDDARSFTFSCGGSVYIDCTVTVSAKGPPPKYTLVARAHGSISPGGTLNGEEGGAGASATAKVTLALDKTITRVYDGPKLEAQLACYRELELAPPSTLEKWRRGLGLLADEGALTEVGDKDESGSSAGVELGASGDAKLGGVGVGAKASYEGQRSVRLTEEKIGADKNRITAHIATAQEVSGGASASVVTGGEVTYEYEWDEAETVEFELSTRDPKTYGATLQRIREATTREELDALAMALGSTGWTSAEGHSETVGGKGTFEQDLGGGQKVGLDVGGSSTDAFKSEISLKDGKIGAKGSGTQTDELAVSSAAGTEMLGVENVHGGAASSDGSEASLELSSKTTEKTPGLGSGKSLVGEVMARSSIIEGVRSYLTKEETTLSGTGYRSADVWRLVGYASQKGVWSGAVGVALPGPPAQKAWEQLGRTLRSPARSPEADRLHARIAADPQLDNKTKERLVEELDLALSMRALNLFLSQAGNDGQSLIRAVLERAGQGTHRGGVKKAAGSSWYWPPELKELQGRWTKSQAEVAGLEGQAMKLLEQGLDGRDEGLALITGATSRLDGVLRDFEAARGEHYVDHPREFVDMKTKMEASQRQARKVRAAFDQAAVEVEDRSVEPGDGPPAVCEATAEPGPDCSEERAAAHAEDRERVETAQRLERARKIQQMSAYCRGFKLQETKLLGEARDAFFQSDATRILTTSLAQGYDEWIGHLLAYRDAYRDAQWPVETWKISADAKSRRNLFYEPDVDAFEKVWRDALGSEPPSTLVWRLRSY